MADYENNSVIRKRRDGVEYQEFYPGKSKPIIDEIDRELAAHYGFTEEELDFIINYDIKYRMGSAEVEANE
jgi:ribosomal protein S24E